MSDDTFINEVMGRLKDKGVLMIPDDFIDQLIITLHANVTANNSLIEIVEVENQMLALRCAIPTGSRQVDSFKELSKRIAEIAFNVEDVRNEKDNKINLKADHGAHSRTQIGKCGLLLSFIIFMAWVAGISLLLSLVACQPVNVKQIATNTNNGYYTDLLKKHASGKPSRELLAFFVPDNSAASQAVPIYSSIVPHAYLSVSRGQTIISIANHLLTYYDGLTLQNKIAVRRICRAVACVTESKTCHPMLLLYSVTHTQKITQGGHNHA